MSLVSSTITLRDFALVDVESGQVIESSVAVSMFGSWLGEAQRLMNDVIKTNFGEAFEAGGSFSSFASRTLKHSIEIDSFISNQFDFKEMCRSEALRLLAAHSRRQELATYLNSKNWSVDFDEAKADLKKSWLNYELFKNVMRSGKAIQDRPLVRNPVIPLSKSSNWHADERVTVTNNLVTIHSFKPFDKKYDVLLPVPSKLLRIHPHIFKWCLPNVRVDAITKELCFDFCVVEEVPSVEHGGSVIASDPGVLRPSVCARVYEDGSYSEEFKNSIETERSVKSSRSLEKEIHLLEEKQKRRAALGFCDLLAQRELVRLRKKLRAVNDHIVWNAAHDVINHALGGETIGVENNKFSTGSWRSGELRRATLHVAAKTGHPTILYSAKDASHTCPVDNSKINPDDERISTCKKCDWTEDRDYTGAVVGGVRTMRKISENKKLVAKPNLSRQKSKPTSKRPHRKPTKYVAGTISSNNAFGGNTYTRVILSLPTIHTVKTSSDPHTSAEPIQKNHKT